MFRRCPPKYRLLSDRVPGVPVGSGAMRGTTGDSQQHLEPLVLDVWIEVVGAPLRLLSRTDGNGNREPPVLWMTRSDPKRSVLVSNTSRANLELYTYIVTENDKLPFRLYLRFYDVRPPICPCVTAYESDSYRESSASSSVVEDVETGVELFLGADYGQQDYSYYKVEPSELMLERGCTTKLKVTLESSDEYIPAAGVIIRAVPVDKAGLCWCRPGVPAQFLSLVQVNRVPKLEVSCSRVYIKLSALELPMNDVLRTRKKLFIQNTGSASLEAELVTEAPWSVVVPQQQCHMRCLEKVPGADVMGLTLPPTSSAEVSMEVSVITKEVWPKPGQVYAKRRSTTSYLRCFNKHQVLLMHTAVCDRFWLRDGRRHQEDILHCHALQHVGATER
ncbi:unnamed protein product [Leptidea sinapis]|uniref:Uncharacterized protein n=1 Tax=Leptidea sinapis TaxID=189913 RepID=A0A5E4R1N8_9NEOP|nr:unnamed protein product [Leptidea sinapis]